MSIDDKKNELIKNNLIYDIKNGWKPNIEFNGLVPLLFNDPFQNNIFYNLNNKWVDYSLIYQNYNPENNYDLHYYFWNKGSSYNIKGSNFLFYSNEILRNAIFKNNKLYNSIDYKNYSVIFNSNYESGNLNFVLKNKNIENNYYLFLRIDSNTKGHTQWFYFDILTQKKQTLKINIVNMSKIKSIYNKSGRPFVWILDKFNNKIVKNWFMLNDSHLVNYTFNKDLKNNSPFNEYSNKNYITLSFEFKFNPKYKYYFCYSIPYTFSKLNRFISTINSVDLKKKIFCRNISGVEVPYLKITDYNCNKINIKNRPIIYIFARLHPSETAGSFVCEGFVEKLLENTYEMKVLRRSIIFKIIPMINIDGVICGNFRTSIIGDDLNRKFVKTNKDLHWTIIQIKKKIKIDVKKGKKIWAAYDLHGHSNRKNVFIYGSNYKKNKKLQVQRGKMYAFLMSKKNKIFKYPYCIWNLAKWKISTLRGFLLKHSNTKLVFTIESSISQYSLNNKIYPFTENDYKNIGKDFINTLYKFMEISINNEDFLIKKYYSKNSKDLVKNKKILKNMFYVEKLNVNNLKNEIKKEDNRLKLEKIKFLKENNNQDYNINDDNNYIEGGSDSEDSEDDYKGKEKRQLLLYFKNYQNKIFDNIKQKSEKINKITKNKLNHRININKLNKDQVPKFIKFKKNKFLVNLKKIKSKINIKKDKNYRKIINKKVSLIIKESNKLIKINKSVKILPKSNNNFKIPTIKHNKTFNKNIIKNLKSIKNLNEKNYKLLTLKIFNFKKLEKFNNNNKFF